MTRIDELSLRGAAGRCSTSPSSTRNDRTRWARRQNDTLRRIGGPLDGPRVPTAVCALLGLFEPEERALFESGGDRGLRVDGSGVGAG